MIIKKYACVSILIGLGSVVGLMVAAPSSLATDTAEPTVSATVSAKDQNNGTLRQGIPGRRIGGGTRRDRVFRDDYAYLTAMVTPDNLGVTTAAHPTLLFFVPEMVSANNVELVLRDRNDKLIYETTFQVAPEGGIVSVETAEATGLSALNLNENYQWYFSIVPNEADRANDIVVHGSIRRVDQTNWLAQQPIDHTLAAQLAIAPPLMKAKMLYQRANLWHDAAIILDELRQAEPENEAIIAEWNQLLELAGLGIAAQTTQPHIQISLN